MKKLNAQSILFYTICGLATVLTLLLGYTMVYATKLEDKVTKQEQEIAELNQTIGEYRINEAWFEEYIDLIEEIYEGKINEAILKERVKQLENAKNEKPQPYIYDVYEDYVNQIIDDLDDAIEITIYYYENTDQAVDLATFIATNYPALYERLLSYT